MRFSTFALLTSVTTVVNAHFQVSYPLPRGPFVEDDEVNFCDNYVHAVSNRSEFPLSGGYVTLNSEHPNWSLAVLLSTVQDPTSFDNFTTSSGQQQFVRDFAMAFKTGANVTIQLVFNGGDGSLYQCSDLTLSKSFTVPSNVSCSNVTTTSSSSTPSATSASSTGNSASKVAITGIFGVLGLIAAMIVTL
ncbi:hypothetical protein EDB85DRAFT_2205590 [Lactarius pseudohatsudake]|nr:hypothetical protein EDB85DRAFT_2205590 [Lactarius pseudohatsudake]